VAEGKLFIVGIGPGGAGQMSRQACEAIATAEVVVGYGTYLDLVPDLLAGKEVIRTGMTQEVERARTACEHAHRGKTVALVSSGDAGIYGMAGPAYESLLQSGWQPGQGIEVEVVPGITALSACAALVGAPLTHDFCAISLSDLLTPWPVIARRLDAAARGDFVIALYNPKSRRRQGQIAAAQRILLRYRDPATPVAIVEAAYREGQAVRLVSLAEMAASAIGMLATVLIGNGQTVCRDGLMATPRGYADKYEGPGGAVRPGEARGRPLSQGLNGWQAGVRRALSEDAEPSIFAIAERYDVPLGEVLAAFSEVLPDASPVAFTTARVRAGTETELLRAARTWGRICLMVRAPGGAAAELRLDAADLELGEDRLAAGRDGLRLDIHRSPTQRLWLVRRRLEVCGLHVVDAAGAGVCELALERRGAEGPAPVAMQPFDEAWRRFGENARSAG